MLQQPVAHINARHSSAAAKSLTSEEMSGLEPTIFLAKGAKSHVDNEPVGECWFV